MLLLFESYLRASPCGEVQTKENENFVFVQKIMDSTVSHTIWVTLVAIDKNCFSLVMCK